MDNTLLVSLSHQLASYRAMDVIANNLANMSTPAYKREAVQFKEYVEQLPPAKARREPADRQLRAGRRACCAT